MRASERFATILFFAAATAARFFERKNNLDTLGLPLGGIPYFAVVLAAAGAVFFIMARKLPERDAVTVGFGRIFRFEDQLVLTAGVGGAFLLLASAALRIAEGGVAGLNLLLAGFLGISGAALLYVLVALRRTGSLEPLLLLVPVCYLVVQLIMTYRVNARDSVLLHFYVEILAIAALCLAALYLAAFAFRSGSPRSFFLAAHMALVLLAGCCVDMLLERQIAALVGCAGALMLLCAFLEAAGDFEG